MHAHSEGPARKNNKLHRLIKIPHFDCFAMPETSEIITSKEITVEYVQLLIY